MVGSSALATRLDPEDNREVVSLFQACCAAEIKRFDGTVAQFLGDGVLAYFGYPKAHEDDAERAVSAGLALIKALDQLKTPPGVELRVRIGIATGLVVIGDLVRGPVTQENVAIGMTTNLAARLQALAEPNTVVIAPQTHQLVSATFECRDLGSQLLKGFEQPVRVHQVLKASDIEGRFEARHLSGLAPLRGRGEDLDLLLRRWQQAKSGHGRVVLLTGEAGIGKSRLLRAFEEQTAGEAHARINYHCSPHHRDSALHPIIGQLERAASIGHDDTALAKLEKLQALLARSSDDLIEDLAVFSTLLSIPMSDRLPALNLTPQQVKERTLHGLTVQVREATSRKPVLIVIEDLHWVDATSLEFFSRVVVLASSRPILVLATARREFVPPWPHEQHISTMMLTRLGRSDAQALVADVTGGKPLPDEVLEHIIDRTDGVPLFVEELTKAVLESGLLREAGNSFELTGPLPPLELTIPSTLHASLLARLDRLSVVKNVAQIAATIGRQFSYELVAAVAGLNETELRLALEQLTRAELIFQRGAIPDATFIFKHALVHDTAYASLVRGRRQQLHGQIVHAIEDQKYKLGMDDPALLAHHYFGATEYRKAIGSWTAAAERASGRSALVEAANLIQKAVDALQHLPSDRERLQLELDLTLKLATVQRSAHGYAAPVAEKHYLRARELCHELSDTDKRFSIEWGLFQCYFVKGEMAAAGAIATELLEHARVHPARPLVDAQLAEGMVRYQLGNLEGAKKAFEAAVGLTKPETDEPHFFSHGQNPGIFCASYLARTLWLLGYPDQAKAIIERNVAIARTRMHDTGHLHSYVNALTTAVGIYCSRREPAVVKQLGEMLVTIARRYHYNYYEVLAVFDLAWAVSADGDPSTGITQMQQSLAALEKTGTVNILPGYYARLADLLKGIGRHQEAFDALERARHPLRTRIWDAEIDRITGELLVATSVEPRAAARVFERGIETARQQHGRSLELRLVASYARLLQSQGETQKGLELLEQCVRSFDEGFDTKDMITARTLILELRETS
jgi:class 3 adenylate cyclase/tetratricopeptide (TPR) repeat protein